MMCLHAWLTPNAQIFGPRVLLETSPRHPRRNVIQTFVGYNKNCGWFSKCKPHLTIFLQSCCIWPQLLAELQELHFCFFCGQSFEFCAQKCLPTCESICDKAPYLVVAIRWLPKSESVDAEHAPVNLTGTGRWRRSIQFFYRLQTN